MTRARMVGGLAALMALALSLTACAGGSSGGGGSGGSDSPLKVLAFYSYTGPAAAFSTVYRPPVTLALKKINDEDGGINGRKLDIEVIDSQINPGQAVSNYNAKSKDALAIATGWSAEASALGPLVARDKMPTTTEVSDASFTTKYRPYVYSVTPPVKDITSNSIKSWMTAVPALKKVVVLQDKFNAQYPSQAGAAETVLKDAGVSVDGIGFAQDTTDFTSLVSRAMSGSPDGIVVGGDPNSGAAIVKQLNKESYKGSIYVVTNVFTAAFTKLVGDAGAGVYSANALNMSDPAAAEFVAAYKPLSGGVAPSYAGAQAYEQLLVLADALRRTHAEGSGSIADRRAAVVKALGATSIPGVAGNTVAFQPSGFVEGAGVFFQLQPDGTVKVLTT
jgi:branched-chain amino acid transport system substrate-binding protein